MKYIIVIPDGMADRPLPELENKTPLEVCKLPNMRYFAKNGKVGMTNNTPSGIEPGSDVAMLSILGFNPKKVYTGRAPLEAANMGIKLEVNEVAFRCNFITESEGKLADYSAGHVTTKESRILINHLNKKLSNDFLKFFPGVGYRHILVIKDSKGLKGLSARCYPPHNIVGKDIRRHLPRGVGAELLTKIMLDAREILRGEEINQVRLDLKENPANMIWLWGQGITPQLPRFIEKYGLTGSIISAVDLIKGIGRLIGLTVIDVPGATGYIDTDYEAKARWGLESLSEKDFVLIHIEAPDEAGHEGKLRLKMQAMENIDHLVLSAIRKYMDEHHDTRLLVLPDHATPLSVKTHVHDDVPFILFGKNILKDEIERFSEATAKYSSLQFKNGWELMDYFIGNK